MKKSDTDGELKKMEKTKELKHQLEKELVLVDTNYFKYLSFKDFKVNINVINFSIELLTCNTFSSLEYNRIIRALSKITKQEIKNDFFGFMGDKLIRVNFEFEKEVF